MGKYFLGLDNGGTMTKAAIFDLQGREIAVVSEKTPIIIPKEGYAERDMLSLWNVNASVIRNVLCKAGIDNKEIVGVGCTGHGKGLYLWGKNNQPAYNAITSTDSRAASIIEKWDEKGVSEKTSQKTLQYPISCQPVALLAWLKENNPQVYSNIKWIFAAKDFTRFMLTGEAYAEVTDYSGTCLMNLVTGQFDEAILKDFGIEEVFDCLPPLKNSFDICGYITKEAANKTGLAEGTLVCGGMFDIDACAISMDVSDESKICVVTGTWSINEYISKKPVKGSKSTLNSFFCIPDYYLIDESSPTSAGNLEWYISRFMEKDVVDSKQTGESVYKIIDHMVASVGPEESNIIFVPFLYGTNDEKLDSAVFFGLNASHQKGHLLRAIFEGVVFSHLTHIEKLLSTRSAPETIRLAGGVANSNVWLQMFADAIGITVEVADVKELGTLGCAMAVAVAADVYKDYKLAAKEMVRITKCIHPNSIYGEIYQRKYAQYKKLIEFLGKSNL